MGILFFGTTFGYGTFKLFDNKPGLIINDNGVIDNSNMSSIGFIEWTDIKEIKTINYGSTSFLLIFLYDDDKYMIKANGFKRILLKLNYKKYKTPISIIPNTLDCTFNDLANMLIDSLERKRK